MKRHCIVTEEYSGLNKSGGIGAASRGLVELLVQSGAAVDVLVTDPFFRAGNVAFDRKDHLSPNFVCLQDLIVAEKRMTEPNDSISRSYSVYMALKNKSYDIIHFNDWLGSGFYTAMARKLGLLDAYIVTHTHGGSEWVRRYNNYLPGMPELEREAIEKSQIENSDEVVSPSLYLLKYYEDRGVAIKNGSVRNWFLPQWFGANDDISDQPLVTRSVEPGSLKELIFFGRHERRKGFEVFVDALSRLPPEKNLDVTFIGRFDRVSFEFSGSHAFRKLQHYAGRIRFFNDMNQQSAWSQILSRKDALCVMPSLIENSPCVVGECLSFGIPFLTTNVGGIPELIDIDSQGQCTCAPESTALANSILEAIDRGMGPIKSTLNPKLISEQWIAWEKSINPSKAISVLSKPLVTVCLVHHERPQYLERALLALMAQTYENIEIVIVDDGSRSARARDLLASIEQKTDRFPIRVIRSENRYLGAARNLAASHARGEYLLFHDDDNYAEPREVEIFVKAALYSGSDILTSQYWVFFEDKEMLSVVPDVKEKRIEYFPIGLGGLFSLVVNRFGDANALFKKSAFIELGGFTELHGVGWEDWELFLKAYFKGMSIFVVPEPLFNYRVSRTGMLALSDSAKNAERLYNLIDEVRPAFSSDFVRCINGVHIQAAARYQKLQILKSLPTAQHHIELMETEPNSEEARVRLSDLAFELGRTADAFEIGSFDLQQRKRLGRLLSSFQLPAASHELRPSSQVRISALPGKAYFVDGWAFQGDGDPVSPVRAFIGSERYDVVSRQKFPRDDVANLFGLSSEANHGFSIVLKPASLSLFDRLNLLNRRKKLGGDLPAGLFFEGKYVRFRGHYDAVAVGLLLQVDFGEELRKGDRLIVDTDGPARVLICFNDNDWKLPVQTDHRQLTFNCPVSTKEIQVMIPEGKKYFIGMKRREERG